MFEVCSYLFLSPRENLVMQNDDFRFLEYSIKFTLISK